MKKITKYILVVLLFAGMHFSCDDYMEVNLQAQLTIEETFDKRKTTENFLANVYSYLPYEWLPFDSEGSVVARSDEASFSWPWLDYTDFNNGTWGSAHWQYKTWTSSYQGIEQAAIFMEYIHRCKEIDVATQDIMRAEARFVRAYIYFCMLRKYGPVYVWGDQRADSQIKPESIDRHSWDVNYDFIMSEYDKAIEILPTEIKDEAWYGRITKGAAMAAKARLTLYAARPLFNGSDIYKSVVNKDGEHLFAQSYDASKWDVAAKASKDIIDLQIYDLYKDKDAKVTDPLQKAIKSYQGVIFNQWNEEIIWAQNVPGFDYNVRSAPPRAVREGYGGFAPSVKLVDAYPMAESGRFPVTGYMANGEPIIDSQSGYVEKGFTESWKHPIESARSMDPAPPIKAHNSIVGRDARFYASVFANGMYWINTFQGNKQITFFNDPSATSRFTTQGDCVKVGYLWRRMFDPTNNHEENKWGTVMIPKYRLAEIYLNYAEACNEKTARDEAEALKYVNLIRERVNLKKLEVVYPEVKGNQKLLRELIAKERFVELAFEGQRYYDIRTCMTAPVEYNGKRYARNLLATNYEDSWERTDQIFKDLMVFKDKHYLFPIHQEQQAEMVNMTQNYGWD